MALESRRPIFWIVAGPNGSGKSSLYTASDIDAFGSSIWIINPDLLAARIAAAEMLPLTEGNLQAVKRIYRWLEASIEAHQTIGSKPSSRQRNIENWCIPHTTAALRFASFT